MTTKKITAEEFGNDRINWPFKDFKVGEGLEFEDGYKGKTIEEIRNAARSYAHQVGKKFSTAKKENKIQVIRTA